MPTRSGGFRRFGFRPSKRRVRAGRRPPHQDRRRNRAPGVLRPVGRVAGSGGGARPRPPLRPDRAAGPLRRRARARAGLPLPPLPDPAGLPGRAPAAGPLPRVLPVRHRRHRPRRALSASRRRGGRGRHRHPRGPGHRVCHPPYQQPPPDEAAARRGGNRVRGRPDRGAARGRQDREEGSRRRRPHPRRLGPEPRVGREAARVHLGFRLGSRRDRIGALHPPRQGRVGGRRGGGGGPHDGRSRGRRGLLRPRPGHRPRPRLLHRHRVRDPPRRPPGAGEHLLRRPLRRPRRPVHDHAPPRRRDLDRVHLSVLAAAKPGCSRRGARRCP